jgi:hypothetical protein
MILIKIDNMKEIEIELNIGGVDITVSGEYYPEEPREMYDGNMEGYPGYPAEFNINSIQVNGKDITELVSDNIYEEIIEKVIENQQNQ